MGLFKKPGIDSTRSPSERRFLWLGPLLAVILVLFCSVFVYWLIDRRPPLIAASGEFIGWDNNVPRRGHVVWRGIQRRACEGTIYRYIVDGEIVTLPPRPWEYRGPIDNPKDDPTTWGASFDVPDHINHDAAYRNRIEYICNPLHKLWPIVVAPPDVPFILREEDRNAGYAPRPNASRRGAIQGE